MATPHHGVSEEMRLENERLRRLVDQFTRMDKPYHPRGRLDPTDDGELTYAIGADADNGIVRIDFGKPVEWLGLPPENAIELAQLLIKNARSIATEPIRISLY